MCVVSICVRQICVHDHFKNVQRLDMAMIDQGSWILSKHQTDVLVVCACAVIDAVLCLFALH